MAAGEEEVVTENKVVRRLVVSSIAWLDGSRGEYIFDERAVRLSNCAKCVIALFVGQKEFFVTNRFVRGPCQGDCSSRHQAELTPVDKHATKWLGEKWGKRNPGF